MQQQICVCMGLFSHPPCNADLQLHKAELHQTARGSMRTQMAILLQNLQAGRNTQGNARHANYSLHKDGSEVVVVADTPEDKTAINRRASLIKYQPGWVW